MRVDRDVAPCVVAVGILDVETQIVELVADLLESLREPVQLVHTIWAVRDMVGLSEPDGLVIIATIARVFTNRAHPKLSARFEHAMVVAATPRQEIAHLEPVLAGRNPVVSLE